MLGGQEACDVLAVVVEELADGEEEGRAPRKRHRAPRGKRLARRLHREVDLLASREVDLTGLPAERRVVDRPTPPRLSFDDSATDPVADALDVLVSFDGWGR